MKKWILKSCLFLCVFATAEESNLDSFINAYDGVLPKSLQECGCGDEIVKRAFAPENDAQFSAFRLDAEKNIQDIEEELIARIKRDAFYLPSLLMAILENLDQVKASLHERDKWLLRICSLESPNQHVCRKVLSVLSCSLEEKLRKIAYLYTIYLNPNDEEPMLVHLHEGFFLKSLYLFIKLFSHQISYDQFVIYSAKLEWEMLEHMQEICMDKPDSMISQQIADALYLFPKIKACEMDEADFFLLGTEQISPQGELEEDVGMIFFNYIFELFELGLGTHMLFDPTHNLQNVFNIDSPVE